MALFLVLWLFYTVANARQQLQTENKNGTWNCVTLLCHHYLL